MKIAKNIEFHSNFLRVVFMYKKVKCSECLHLKNTPSDIKKAINIRDDILYEIRNEKFDYAKRFPNSNKVKLFCVKPQSYTMKSLLEAQLNHIQENKYANSTKKDYCRYINSELIPYFGKYLVTNLKPVHIISWVQNAKQTNKYIKNVLLQLRVTLSDAFNVGIITENPFNQFEVKRLLKTRSVETDYEVDPFTKEERQAILNSADGEVKNLIMFGLFTGLRTGEILALKWENVNLINKKFYVKHTMNNGMLVPPKTKMSNRTINLLPKAFEALNEQLNYKNDDGFVFHNPNTEKFWPLTDSFRKHWVKLLKKAKIKYRNPYQMRHTFASMLITDGENIHKVAHYLGHKNTNMVTKTYGKYIAGDCEGHGFKKDYDE